MNKNRKISRACVECGNFILRKSLKPRGMMDNYLGPSLIAVGGGCALFLFGAAMWAMLHDGTIKLDFNRWGEGWFEVGGLAVIVVVCVWCVLRFFGRD